MARVKSEHRHRIKPIRFKVFRSDASVQSAQRTLERKFGLPMGSVKVVYPNGRRARSDSTVGALLKYWDRKT